MYIGKGRNFENIVSIYTFRDRLKSRELQAWSSVIFCSSNDDTYRRRERIIIGNALERCLFVCVLATCDFVVIFSLRSTATQCHNA